MPEKRSVHDEDEDEKLEPLQLSDLTFESFSRQRPLRHESGISISSQGNYSECPRSPFYQVNNRDIQTTFVSIPPSRDRFDNSCSVKEFIEKSDDFATSLRDLAATRLGSFTIPDSDAAKVFGRNTMLTRGYHSLFDHNWQSHWRDRIRREKDKWFQLAPDEWSEEVKLGAYAVNIRNIAERTNGALLSALLNKTDSGAMSRHIWEFPVVEAVINYHWQTWAYMYLFIQLCLFASWTATFVFYLVLYIEYDLKTILEDNEHDTVHNPHVLRLTTLLNAICLGLMLPFAYIEVQALSKQKGRWFQARNAVDISVILLQVFFFVCHFTNYGIGEEWYSALLTFHTVLMFIKLLDYGRVLGLGTDFVEAFLYVLYDVRYFVLFIITSVIGAALCFATLFRGERDFETKHGHMEFSSVPHAMVTAFSIMFGQFETDYVFKADYPWLKGTTFFMFQMLMTVTTLNLLIAVMTQSYSRFVEDRGIRYNIGRASVIDELQVIRIPHFFNKSLAPYIHFLVVEPNPENPHTFPAHQSLNSSTSVDELRREVASLSQNLQSVLRCLEKMQRETGSQRVSSIRTTGTQGLAQREE